MIGAYAATGFCLVMVTRAESVRKSNNTNNDNGNNNNKMMRETVSQKQRE